MNTHDVPEALALIAGKGSYPIELARSARAQGVSKLFAVAFRGETSRAMTSLADEISWLYVGQLQRMLDTLVAYGARDVVMAGQITPTNLFKVRMDKPMLDLLRALPRRNAETIFGALGEQLAARGMSLRPASLFMEKCLPQVGLIGGREPSAEEWEDIHYGQRIAHESSRMDIGQTVVVKRGTVLAVEAFEGTDQTILRAGRLGGPGSVVVKVAKQGHDMRFDIPVLGKHTLKSLRRARASVMAVEAQRAIILDKSEVQNLATRQNQSIIAIEHTGAGH